MKKRVLGIIMSIIMILSVCCFTTIHAETTTGGENVAEVNGNQYPTVKAAVDAINGKGTITLNLDSEEASFNIAAGKDIILDLNGHTLTLTTKNEYLKNLGKLQITGNGTLTRKNQGYLIDNQGDLTIDNGNFSADDINDTVKSSLIRNLGTMNIKGGTFVDKDIVIKNDDKSASSYGKLTISGGTFTSKKVESQTDLFVVLQNSGEVNISGGTFTGSKNIIRSYRCSAPTKTIISGGTYTTLSDGWVLVNYFDNYGSGKSLDNIISGGIFKGKFDESKCETTDYTGTINTNITDGTFNNDVTQWIDNTRSCVKVGDVYKIAPKATGITLSKTEVQLAKGTTSTLTATLAPVETLDKATWTSDNESIATVDANGVVTAHGKGTAQITATVGEKSATCEVIVYEIETPVIPTTPSTGVIIDKEASKVLEDSVKDLIANIDTTTAISEETKEIIKSAIKDGATISVEPKVEAVDVNTIDKKVLAMIEETLGTKDKIAQYFELNMDILVNGSKVGTINELTGKVKFTITIDESLIEEGKEFYMIRYHEDGSVEKIEGTLVGNQFTFETDKFSTYALAYEIVSGVDTGDTSNPSMLLGLMGLAILLAGKVVYTKKVNR